MLICIACIKPSTDPNKTRQRLMNTVQWLNSLIGFDTVSSNSNIELIKAAQAWFSLHNIASEIIPGENETKGNLFATIPGADGTIKGGLLLSGHTDVVPIGGQIWVTDPFKATELNGKIYGRGACDMKGFIAVLLALTPELKNLKLIKPVHFALTCDEEIGCLGVDYLIDYLNKMDINPEGCIVGEPSNMQPVIGEKGRRLYHCQVQGKSVHSSLASEGCNAIVYASRLVGFIDILAQETKKNGPFDHDFDVPFTTVTTNIISGGIASNIIPNTCEFITELRYIEQYSLDNFYSQVEDYIKNELLPDMRTTFSDAAIYFDETSDSCGFGSLEHSKIIQIVRHVTGVGKRSKVSYTTEASSFQNAGIPTVICGPGNIEQAHTANEFITTEQLVYCQDILRKIILNFCGSKT